VRRDPHDPLAGGQQRLLEPPRDVPAVLDRPHALLIQATGPADRGEMARLVGLELPLSSHPAGALVHRRQRVRSLVRVRADHDHLPPSLRFGLNTNEADLGGRLSLGAVATLLSGHAEGPRAAAGDRTFASQTGQATEHSRVSPPPAREPTGRLGRHRPDPGDSDSERTLDLGACSSSEAGTCASRPLPWSDAHLCAGPSERC
jgi:hypothetical protein